MVSLLPGAGDLSEPAGFFGAITSAGGLLVAARERCDDASGAQHPLQARGSEQPAVTYDGRRAPQFVRLLRPGRVESDAQADAHIRAPLRLRDVSVALPAAQ